MVFKNIKSITMEEANNPQAFPCDSRESRTFSGMTLRDYFAAKAMQSYVIRYGVKGLNDSTHIADVAYTIADAMLKERQQ